MMDQNLKVFLRSFLTFLKLLSQFDKFSFEIFHKNRRSLAKSWDLSQQLLSNNLSFSNFLVNVDMTSPHKVNWIFLFYLHKNNFHSLQNTVPVIIKLSEKEFTI